MSRSAQAPGAIVRDPRAVDGRRFDLAIVGAGIYGSMLALESARRGLRVVLLERDDFGGATSWNSHRIVHGGFRYLQGLDLRRFRESVAERSWFLRFFPDLVVPLACLMPLYGEGARRPSVLRLGLAVNHLLSLRRNDGLASDHRIESGGVLTPAETVSLFPKARREGLRGGALWYDAVMRSPQRLLMEALRWASAAGATSLNYVEAVGLEVGKGRVVALRARDRESGQELSVHARHVVNCAGPWCRQLAAGFDRDIEHLFRPSLAFNLLLDRPPPAEVAIAVAPPGPDAHTYFLYPRDGLTYAGTAHAPWTRASGPPRPDHEQLQQFLDDLNRGIPGFEAEPRHVRRVFAGLLPARREGTALLATRAVIHDHGEDGGPAGVFSVSGVKYTTARRVAERTLQAVTGDRLPPLGDTARPPAAPVPPLSEVIEAASVVGPTYAGSGGRPSRPEGAGGTPASGSPRPDCLVAIDRLVRDEGVVHLDDLILRRTGWGDDPAAARRVAEPLCSLLGWAPDCCDRELERLDRVLAGAAVRGPDAGD